MTAESTRVSDSLAQIESELKKIWQPDENGYSKPHATTMNLIAIHGRRDSERFEQAVEDVAARLGARTFLVSVDPRLEPWRLDGDVSAVCRLDPGTKKEAVCSERVQLRFGAMVSKRAFSILDALIEASLPTAIFVGPGAHAAVVDSLADTAECIVLDSGELGVARASEIATCSDARIEDLAFVRIRRWREMIARFFDDPEVRPALDNIKRIELRHAHRADHHGASSEAELLVAWLGGRLGWKTERQSLRDGEGRLIEVSIESIEAPKVIPGCVVSFTIEAELGSSRVTGQVSRDADAQHLTWELEAPCTHPAPRRFSIPPRDDGELVERAIRNVQGDQLLRETFGFVQRWKAKLSIPPPAVLVVADADELAKTAADSMAEAIAEAIAERGVARIALSGGNTPSEAYRLLAKSGVDFSRCRWFFVDERCVPPSSDRSNFAGAKRDLFDPAKIAEDAIFRMEGERPSAEEAAKAYAERILFEFGTGPSDVHFDLVIAGLGPDGHTASLFPKTGAVKNDRELVIAVQPGGGLEKRITLTRSVLLAARTVLVLVSGESKRDALGKALSFGDEDEVPARLYRAAAPGVVSWIADRAAHG